MSTKWRALLAFKHLLPRPQLNDAEGCVRGGGGERNWMSNGFRQFGGQDLGEFGVGVYDHESLELYWLRLAPDRGLDVGDGMETPPPGRACAQNCEPAAQITDDG